MKKIGHRLIRIVDGAVEQEWIGDWDYCPSIPPQVHLSGGLIVEGAGPGSIIDYEGTPTFRIDPVMGSPEARHVNAECARRIESILSIPKQLNRQAAHLAGNVSPEFAAASVVGWNWIDETKQSATDLKALSPIPDDFADDGYWPTPPESLNDW